jgi:16S rRNA (guanine527-N7)-methyltransferase
LEEKMAHGKELLECGIKKLNIDYTDKQLNQFMKYYELLIKKNKVMNLTAITDLDEVMVKHFLDSVLISDIVDLLKYNSLIDVGTGAGFPGIPLKILFPHLNVTLVDSLNKRLKFLNEVIDELQLENITTVHGRAEDLGQNTSFRQKYDLCVSRAVANLSTLSEYCIPLIREDGIFVSYKSSDSDEEVLSSISAIKILGGKIINQKKINLPMSDMERNIIVIKKERKTPNKYPRKAGTPSKEPLK